MVLPSMAGLPQEPILYAVTDALLPAHRARLILL